MAQPVTPRDALPRVDVLMATYNGRQWIEMQVDSILGQKDVDVRLIVSDDGSTDGTRDYVSGRADQDPRVTLLPPREGTRGITANFLRLFTDHPAKDDVFIAFSDQDDIWRPDKLRRQVSLLESSRADAVSSNVVSFDERGHRRLVAKASPQQRWDFLFEAAGPGSTYVFTPRMHALLVHELEGLDTERIGVHDWFLYALTRASGGSWLIDAEPLVAYRQHGDNAQGEHHGADAFRQRLAALRSGFYRDQFIRTAEACRQVGTQHQDAAWLDELDAITADLRHRDVRSRWRIARRLKEIRRNRLEGIELAASCLIGIW
jgi:rhamnosyltransferase|nr:glycosyltransferase [Actinomyces sp.]